ncbi:MAG: hypothetical protein FWG62_07750 [Proteobacteria bacterium]|nr:hypothetical protein [Pseudomonadota bacterium]
MGISLNMKGINCLNSALLQGKDVKIKQRSILLFPVLGKNYKQVDQKFNHIFNLLILLRKNQHAPVLARDIQQPQGRGRKSKAIWLGADPWHGPAFPGASSAKCCNFHEV